MRKLLSQWRLALVPFCLLALIVVGNNRAFGQASIVPEAQSCFQATTGINGMVGSIGTITGGAGGNSGIYTNVPLTGGAGAGATANITVSGGAVTQVQIFDPGINYVVSNTLSASPSNIGGVTGFSVPVLSVSINSSLAGGTVGMYVPGTLTFKSTWRNANETTLNTNPIPLDQNGCAIIYGQGSYRQVVKDSLGNTIWDSVTAAPSTGTATFVTDVTPVGTIIATSAFSLPTNYLWADGSQISRSTFSDLLNAVAPATSGTTIIGNPTISGLPITTVTAVKIGAFIEGSCLPPNTTVSVVATSTSLTLSANATSNGACSVRIFPFGHGNGTTTFNLPDLRGRAPVGQDNLGGTPALVLTGANCLTSGSPSGLGVGSSCGSATHTMTSGELVAHTHLSPTLTDPTHRHFEANTDNIVSGSLTNTNHITQIASQGAAAAAYTFAGSGTEATIGLTSASSTGITLSTTTGSTGSTTAFSVVQPVLLVNYAIKYKVESPSGAGGVISIGGMTGDILCGGFVVCSNNTISVMTTSNGILWANAPPYNAACDGVTNDSPAFQSLFNDAQTLGVPARFTGSCRIEQTLVTSGGVLDFSGTSYSNSVLIPSADIVGIDVASGYTVFLHDFQISYAPIGGANSGVTGLRVLPVGPAVNVYSRFTNLYIDQAGNGMTLDKTNDWVISGIVINNFKSNGMIIENTLTADQGDNVIQASTFIGAAGSGVGIVYKSSGGLRFIGNKILGDIGIGFQMALADGAFTADLVIVGNSIEVSGGSAPQEIFLGRAGTTGGYGNVQISSNNMSFGKTCVVAPTDANGQWLLNVAISNNTCILKNDADAVGFDIDDAIGIVFSGNTTQSLNAGSKQFVIRSGVTHCGISGGNVGWGAGFSADFFATGACDFILNSNSGAGGLLALAGSSSGQVTQTTQAAAGTTSVVWGNSSGTPVVTASSPLVINATTGNITCPTCTNSALTNTHIFVGNASNVATDVAMSGDATMANTGALTLASVISAGGPTGSATVTPIITYDAKGRLTAVSSATITPAASSLTGLGTGVATALGVNVGTAGAFIVNGGALGTPSSGTLTNASGLPTTGLTGTLQAAQEPAHAGDVTNSAGSLALTIANGAVTYAKTANLGALSVMGRSANSSGVGADIQATAASDAVLRESGSTLGFGTIATGGIANNAVTLAKLATQATNTVLGNATSGSAVPTALSVGSCSTSASALIWTTNTGFGCNTAINAATLGGATFASPAAIGTGTPAAGTFTSVTTTGVILANGAVASGATPFVLKQIVGNNGIIISLATSGAAPSGTSYDGFIGWDTANPPTYFQISPIHQGTGAMPLAVPSSGLVVGGTTDPGAGVINAVSGYKANGTSGLSATKTVRASGGIADCTLVYSFGLLTGGTC